MKVVSMSDTSLREYGDYDAQPHCNAVISSLAELRKWFTWAKPDYCLCDSYEFIEHQSKRKTEERYDYAIVNSESGEFLGSCGLTRVKTTDDTERVASMSYWIRTDKSGGGRMKKAIKKLKQMGFDKHNFDIIEIDVAYCNMRSIHIAEGIGAKPQREIAIKGGDGKEHKGRRYVVKRGDCSKSASE